MSSTSYCASNPSIRQNPRHPGRPTLRTPMPAMSSPKPARFTPVLLPLLLAASPLASPAAGPVLIDEVLASNRTAAPVGDRFPDYVELRNASSSTVDLAGCTLSDDGVATAALVLPAGTTLAPGARLVVWCDQNPGLPPPQASFGIGATGDRIRLAGPDGSVWDEIAFGLQATDFALGRVDPGNGPQQPGSWRLVVPSPGAANTPATLGDPALLRVNEWMTAPATGDDWLEVHNTDERPIDLSGMFITDRTALPASNRPIPPHSFIAPLGFIQFFASDLRRPDADHLDFRLSSGGETLSIVAPDAFTVVERITFGSQQPDTSSGRAPDGGPTVVDFGAGRATPGASNVSELTRVIISEVLAHTDPPLEDAIELHNPTAEPVDISFWWLSDATSTPRKYQIPAGTIIAPGGFVAFYQFQFDSGPNAFSLNSYEGDQVWLSVGDATGNLTGERIGVRFGASNNGIPFGIVPTSAGNDFAPLSFQTFGVPQPSTLAAFRQGRGATNAPPFISPVVIAEWFFNPSSTAHAGEDEPFVELLNASSERVRLFDTRHPENAWRLRGDLSFDLPAGLELDPGNRLLVVAFDPATNPARLAAFRSARNIPDTTPILGPWSGAPGVLVRSLELQNPDEPERPDSPRPGFVPDFRVDRLDYRPSSPWPSLPTTGGQALRRTNPSSHGNEPLSWTADLPSPGRDQPAEPNPDRDQDGMPNDWETTHGLNPDSPADALEDPDADGLTNLQEFLAGTDPRNPASTLTLTPTQRDNPAQTLTLAFQAVTGRSYILESRTTNPDSTWSTVGEPLNPSESGPRTFTIQTSGEPRLFRLRIPALP